MAFLVSGRDEEEVKLRAFPLVLKDSAKNWFQNLEPGRKTNWETLKETFLSKYGGVDNPEHLWHRISSLHQATSRTYLTYESQFLRLWAEWEASLAEGERFPNFLKKEKFLAGLFPDLQEKVKGKFPETFEEALQIARVKDRKLEYQAHTSRVEHPQGPTMADERLPPAPTTTPEDPHLELLQRVTNQLDNLSINMVQGVRQQQPQPNNERMLNGPRRQPQRRDYFCYNCGEEGHGMYFCPHPRNFNAQAGRGRQQVTPPRARPPPQIQPQILQNPQMVAQPQVMQRSVAPQPVAEIPPLPNNNEADHKNRAGGSTIDVICCPNLILTQSALALIPAEAAMAFEVTLADGAGSFLFQTREAAVEVLRGHRPTCPKCGINDFTSFRYLNNRSSCGQKLQPRYQCRNPLLCGRAGPFLFTLNGTARSKPYAKRARGPPAALVMQLEENIPASASSSSAAAACCINNIDQISRKKIRKATSNNIELDVNHYNLLEQITHWYPHVQQQQNINVSNEEQITLIGADIVQQNINVSGKKLELICAPVDHDDASNNSVADHIDGPFGDLDVQAFLEDNIDLSIDTDIVDMVPQTSCDDTIFRSDADNCTSNADHVATSSSANIWLQELEGLMGLEHDTTPETSSDDTFRSDADHLATAPSTAASIWQELEALMGLEHDDIDTTPETSNVDTFRSDAGSCTDADIHLAFTSSTHAANIWQELEALMGLEHDDIDTAPETTNDKFRSDVDNCADADIDLALTSSTTAANMWQELEALMVLEHDDMSST
ncbi:hypothetical protein L7F22_004989 [Adiantum nelumboides]|nr:hypothetical protein [Adiantum nelumboides]